MRFSCIQRFYILFLVEEVPRRSTRKKPKVDYNVDDPTHNMPTPVLMLKRGMWVKKNYVSLLLLIYLFYVLYS